MVNEEFRRGSGTPRRAARSYSKRRRQHRLGATSTGNGFRSVSPQFLRYLNEGLERYAEQESVVSICGYSYAIPSKLPETYFLPGAHCWGWATWRRGWELFRGDADKLVHDVVERDLIYELDAGGAEPITQFLDESARRGELSWSLCWMASAILGGKLTLYPGRSLVSHLDYSAGGDAVAPVLANSLSSDAIRVEQIPIEVDGELLRALRASFMESRARKSGRFRLYTLLRRLLPRRLERAIYTSMIKRRLTAGNSGSMRSAATGNKENAVAK